MIERRLVSRPVSTIGTLVAPNRTQEHGPRIVTEGLVGHWDAGNPYSYPGTGTTWTDLAGNSNGTLVNSPSYVAEAGGGFDFSGTNDLIEIPNVASLQVGSAFSMECVIYWNGTNDLAMLQGKRQSTSPFIQWSFYISNSQINAAGNTIAFFTRASGTAFRWISWAMPSAGYYHIAGTADLSGMKLFVNGVERASTTSTTTGDFNTTTRFVIANQDGASAHYNGKLFMSRIYNRVLTAAEITQNFNAIRGRFGL